MTTAQRLICCIPTGQVIDIGHDVSSADYALLANLYCQIGRGDNVLGMPHSRRRPLVVRLPPRQRRLLRRALPGGHRISPKWAARFDG